MLKLRFVFIHSGSVDDDRIIQFLELAGVVREQSRIRCVLLVLY